VTADQVSVWLAIAPVIAAWSAVALAGFQLSKARRLRSLGSRCDCLEADLAEISAVIRKMDARDRMRTIRANRPETDGSSETPIRRRPAGKPDAIQNPQEWKTWMRENYPAVGVHSPPKG